MLLLEILSSSIIPAVLLVVILILTLHIVYLNRSFDHRIRLIVAIKMEEERLAKKQEKPLPREVVAPPVVKEVVQQEIEPIELYDDGEEVDYTKFN